MRDGNYTHACRTIGAVYSSKVSTNEISMSVKLPDTLALTGMTREDAEKNERYLHSKMEDAIVWIIRSHTNNSLLTPSA